MGREKFYVKTSVNANYLYVELEEPVIWDEIAMKVIKEDCPDFLLPYSVGRMNDEVNLRYKLPNMMALKYVNLGDVSGGPVAKTVLPMQGAWV